MGIFQVIPVRTKQSCLTIHQPASPNPSVPFQNGSNWVVAMLNTFARKRKPLSLVVTCPDKMPDLSNHSSFFADVMKANPGLYDKLKTKNTKLGVDNKGHPMIKTVGAVAGDEESYELFRDFF